MVKPRAGIAQRERPASRRKVAGSTPAPRSKPDDAALIDRSRLASIDLTLREIAATLKQIETHILAFMERNS